MGVFALYIRDGFVCHQDLKGRHILDGQNMDAAKCLKGPNNEGIVIDIIINGNPVAQGRPRFFRRGNYTGCYDPGKSKTWKEEVKYQAIAKKIPILKGALHMELSFFLLKPKSLPKRIVHHVKKPDLDNLAKAIKDALKGVAYKDDSQICSLMLSKEYRGNPGVRIIIHEVK